MMRLTLRLAAVAGLAAFLVSPVRSSGASCDPGRNAPLVVFRTNALHQYDPSRARVLGPYFLSKMRNATPGVRWNDVVDIATVAGFDATLLMSGGDADLTPLTDTVGTQFEFVFQLDKVGSVRRASTRLVDTHTEGASHAFEKALPPNDTDDNGLFAAIDSLVNQAAAGLLNDLEAARDHPVVPNLVVALSPEEVDPGGTLHVKATLTDQNDCTVQSGKDVEILDRHGTQAFSSVQLHTNAAGVVEQDLPVGTAVGVRSIEAIYRSERGRVTRANPEAATYRVRSTAGDVKASSPKASLDVGDTTTVTARVTHAGAPVTGKSVTFTSSGGSVTAGPVTTDVNGDASAQFVAPDTNAVVDVTATTQAPTADLSGSLCFVVDAGVTLNLSAPDTAAGTTSEVTADLAIGGTAIAGTNVTFSLVGDGALTATSAPTDAAGRAEVLWVALPYLASSADITATAVVDGQQYVQTVTVHAAATVGTMTTAIVGNGETLYAPVGGRTSWMQVAHSIPDEGCQLTTLAGTFRDCPPPPGPPSGTTTDAPLTLTCAIDGNHRAVADVSRPQPNVTVVDLSGKLTGTEFAQHADIELYIALGFAQAGSLQITWDGGNWDTGTPNVPFFSVSVYDDGGVAGLLGDVGNGDHGAPNRNLDISAAGTVGIKLISAFSAHGNQNLPPFDGKVRITLTFHRQ